jgi:hypothetical protein
VKHQNERVCVELSELRIGGWKALDMLSDASPEVNLHGKSAPFRFFGGV